MDDFVMTDDTILYSLDYRCLWCNEKAHDHYEFPELAPLTACKAQRDVIASGQHLDRDGFDFPSEDARGTGVIADFVDLTDSEAQYEYDPYTDLTFGPDTQVVKDYEYVWDAQIEDDIIWYTCNENLFAEDSNTLFEHEPFYFPLDNRKKKSFTVPLSEKPLNYRDKDSDEQTVTLQQVQEVTREAEREAEALELSPEDKRKHVNRKVAAFMPNPLHYRDVSVTVEGELGYHTEQIIDLHVTRLMQARLLNVWRQNGNLRVGGIEVTKTSGTITAKCVWDACDFHKHVNLDHAYFETITPEDFRALQEQWTFEVLTHGNNHTARTHYEQHSFKHEGVKWYALHLPGCDMNHNVRSTNSTPNSPSSYRCNHNLTERKPLASVLTDQETVQFLLDHAHWCSDTNCNHPEWLDAYRRTLFPNHNTSLTCA